MKGEILNPNNLKNESLKDRMTFHKDEYERPNVKKPNPLYRILNGRNT